MLAAGTLRADLPMMNGTKTKPVEGTPSFPLHEVFAAPFEAAFPAAAPPHAPAIGRAVFDRNVIYRWIWWSTAAVILLGAFREIYVQSYGTGTILKDLRHISLEEKHSLQAWQQSSLALFGVLVTAALAATEPAATGLSRRFGWLAIIMAYISLDEQVTIHTSSVVFMQALLHFTSFFYYVPWVLWAGPLALLIGAYFLPLLTRVPRRFAVGFVASGAIFIGGAVGLETLGGLFQALYGMGSWEYTLEFIAEESCESIGLALFAVTILEYWRATRPEISVRFASQNGR
jgi:hypothetical protein